MVHLNMCRTGEDQILSFTKQNNLPTGRQIVAIVSINFRVDSQSFVYLVSIVQTGPFPIVSRVFLDSFLLSCILV